MDKACIKCAIIYPATPEYFYRRRASMDGLTNKCKPCINDEQIIYQQTERGKAVKKRGQIKYMSSEKGKAAAKQYRQSEKGKAVAEQWHEKYEQSGKGTIMRRKYKHTIRGYLRSVFSNMKRRCTDSKMHNYKAYGGRGIKCVFTSGEFVDYVVNVLKVDPRGLTIDRIDNDGNYERGNIQFITRVENSKKRSQTAKSIQSLQTT